MLQASVSGALRATWFCGAGMQAPSIRVAQIMIRARRGLDAARRSLRVRGTLHMSKRRIVDALGNIMSACLPFVSLRGGLGASRSDVVRKQIRQKSGKQAGVAQRMQDQPIFYEKIGSEIFNFRALPRISGHERQPFEQMHVLFVFQQRPVQLGQGRGAILFQIIRIHIFGQ